MLDGFAAQHNDKRLTTVGIDVGHGMAKPLNQLGTPFLHGKPSMNYYSLKLYFYSFIANAQGAIFVIFADTAYRGDALGLFWGDTGSRIRYSFGDWQFFGFIFLYKTAISLLEWHDRFTFARPTPLFTGSWRSAAAERQQSGAGCKQSYRSRAHLAFINLFPRDAGIE